MTNHLLYWTTVTIWGTSWFAITFQLGPVPPDLSVAYRFMLAAAVLVAYCGMTGRRLRFGWRDQAFIALQGLCLFSSNYVLFYYAAQFLTSGLLAVVFSTLVLMNMGNAALLFGTPIAARTLVGAALGLTGIVALFWTELRGFGVDAQGAIGLGLSLLATVLVSFGNMISVRHQRRRLPVLQTNALGMAYGAVATFTFVVLRGAPLVFDRSTGYVVSLIYLAIFATVIGFGTYLTLLGRIGADRAAYAMVLFPVVALAISTVFEAYAWTPAAISGVALILAGNAVLLLGRSAASSGQP